MVMLMLSWMLGWKNVAQILTFFLWRFFSDSFSFLTSRPTIWCLGVRWKIQASVNWQGYITIETYSRIEHAEQICESYGALEIQKKRKRSEKIRHIIYHSDSHVWGCIEVYSESNSTFQAFSTFSYFYSHFLTLHLALAWLHSWFSLTHVVNQTKLNPNFWYMEIRLSTFSRVISYHHITSL